MIFPRTVELELARLNYLDLENVSYILGPNLLSCCLLSKYMNIIIHQTIIFPLVLHGCETWSLTLRKKHRFTMFQNGVLRKIFWPKRDEVTKE